MKPVAIVYDKKSGRVMNIQATAPCVHFYTANWIINVKGKGGFVYQPRSTLSLETQGYPDAVNHPKFPSTIVNQEKDMLTVCCILSPSKNRFGPYHLNNIIYFN